MPLILPRPKCGTQDQLFRDRIAQRGHLKFKEYLFSVTACDYVVFLGTAIVKPFKPNLLIRVSSFQELIG